MNAPAAKIAPRVTTERVRHHDLPLYIEAVGTLDGYVNAEIRARVRGYLQSQEYKDGAWVQKDQLMFRLDNREYNNAVMTARGVLARAEAAVDRYKALVARYRPLAAKQAVSQQDLDDAIASKRDAEGQLEAASGQLQQVDLNLSYTMVRSPIGGLAGTALVRSGNLVGQDTPTLLTTVSQLEPMRASFPISEIEYLKYPGNKQGFLKRDLNWAQAQFANFSTGRPADGHPVELVLADGSLYPRAGVIVTLNRQIDATTGTIQVQALFPNPDGLLRPGQYCRVRLLRRDVGPNPVVISEKAIRENQGRYTVAVVDPNHMVEFRAIELGPSAGALRVVKSGLKDNEEIVVEGLQKIRNGMVVRNQPTAAPLRSVPPPVGTH